MNSNNKESHGHELNLLVSSLASRRTQSSRVEQCTTVQSQAPQLDVGLLRRKSASRRATSHTGSLYALPWSVVASRYLRLDQQIAWLCNSGSWNPIRQPRLQPAVLRLLATVLSILCGNLGTSVDLSCELLTSCIVSLCTISYARLQATSCLCPLLEIVLAATQSWR